MLPEGGEVKSNSKEPVVTFGYAKRYGFRRAWYILRTGAEEPDWEKLGADYFIAPWERRRFEKKKAGRRRRMLSENSRSSSMRDAGWSGDGAEGWIYGDAPLLEEPFGDVDTIPVLLAPGVQLR